MGGNDFNVRDEVGTTDDTEQRDRAFLRSAGGNAARGIVAGGLIGAAIGLIIGFVGFSDTVGAIVGFALGGLVAGAGVGLLVSSLAGQK